MRILYLHQYFNTPRMSGGTRSYEMARRLVERGHDVNLITASCEPQKHSEGAWYETQESGIRVHWLPVPYSHLMSYPARMAAFVKFAGLAALRTRGLAADVVFATSTPLTIAIPGFLASRSKRVPMVFEVRDLWPEIPIALGALRGRFPVAAALALERFAYRSASRMVALSPAMRDGIVATGFPADRVAVIPNAADLDLFSVGPEPGRRLRRQHEWLQERPLVVYTGTLGLVNGVDYLVRLAAAVERLDPDVRFLIIGSGRQEATVRGLANSLNVLGRNFFMMPDLAKQEVPAWLSAANIATSVVVDVRELWATSANKFFDALAAGKPIAINHEGWQAELLRTEKAGLVLHPTKIEYSARMLVAALRDTAWLATAGMAASRLAQNRFSRDRLAGELERVLQAAVAA